MSHSLTSSVSPEHNSDIRKYTAASADTKDQQGHCSQRLKHTGPLGTMVL